MKVLEEVFYEDMEYDTYPVIFLKTIYYFDGNVYRYVIDQATQSMAAESRRKRISHSERGTLAMIEHYNKWNSEISGVKEEYVKKMIFQRVRGIYSTYLSFSTNKKLHCEQLVSFDKSLKIASQVLYDYAETNSKLILAMRKTNYLLYGLLTRINKQ